MSTPAINTLLQAMKAMTYEYTGIIASVSQDEEEYEHDLLWWDKGVLNSLTVWADDNTAHFSQHYDGKLLKDWRGVVSELHDETVLEWFDMGARCAFSVWPDDDMWLYVAHRDGELIQRMTGSLKK